MRERVLEAIYKKLDDEPNNALLLRQITLLNKASICTIDSFCLDVVRNNFFELENLSPNFRIADTTEIELLKQEVIEDIFENKYEEENEDFYKLVHTYTSYRDDTPLKELVIKIYSYIQSNPFPEKWLNDKVEMFNIKENLEEDFSNTVWGKELLKEIEEELIDSLYSLESISKKLSVDPDLEKFWQTIRSDIDMVQGLKNNLNSWDKAYNVSTMLKFVTWPRKNVESQIKDEAKQVRDDVRKKLKKILDKILICGSKQANQDIYDMYKILINLKKLVLEFEKEFSKRKREKNIVDFHDIEHFALQILLKEKDGKIVPTEIAKKYQQKYDEIAIDEYQDSNLVQEYILNSVSRGKNIFMVGDVKQSIYKFRQAMPELFLNKYNTYLESRDGEENLKIKLFKNFRSRSNVLDFTNLIFQDIMSSNLGDINYDKTEYLNLGANYPNENEQDLKTEIHLINLAEEDINENDDEDELQEERIENAELEARFVANKIKNIVENKYQVWDNKKNEKRNIKYKDIVILLRSTSSLAPVYEQELLNLEIPVFSDSSQEYLNSIEIQTIMSLLKIIDNPMQDIPLVTVLRSYIGKFTDNDLIQMRLTDKYDNFYACMQKSIVDVDENLRKKINQFFEKIDLWRKEQEYLSLDELIWKIYSDTGFYNYVGLMPNGDMRQANLKMLFQKAKQYESSNFKGLYNFINFIDKLQLSSGDMGSAKLIGENDDVVRIMSIHKSKGLEFPVVFLASTSKQFNLMDLNQNVLLHQEMGIGAKYIDYDKQVQYDTLSKAAIRNKILIETISEEMRILYVALTRAKEKLYITGICKDYETEKQKIAEQANRYPKVDDKINPILLKKYKKYLDWIMLVYEYEKENTKDILTLEVHNKQEILSQCKNIEIKDINVIEKIEKTDIDKEKIKKIEDILNYKYPNEIDTIIPTKTSVTAIKELEINKDKKIVKNEITFPKPNFLNDEKEEKVTAARRGTLVHLCLQKLNEKQEYDIKKIQNLIEKLEEKKIITKKEAKAINVGKILEFTHSKIWEDLKEAKEVQKEKPFYINISASEIYNEKTDQNILVQGIIDLYYIDKDDKLILVDYKTDYIESGCEYILKQRYNKQIELYSQALEQALDKKVDKRYIYSVCLNKEIEM